MLTSLSELAKELKINKSSLQYWKKLGIITPEQTVGRIDLYDKEKTLEIIKKKI